MATCIPKTGLQLPTMSCRPLKALSSPSALASFRSQKPILPLQPAYARFLHSRKRAPVIPHTSIQIFREVPEFRIWRRKQLLDHRTVGLVPTMGALHEGHLSLIRMAAAENHNVVVSVYVNPTQFGVHEDLDSYPKTWDKDCDLLKSVDREIAGDGGNLGKISAVFAPTTDVMYPSGPPSQEVNGKGSFVTITPVGELLEGASRPTFFRGVQAKR